MRIHELKIWPEFYAAIKGGNKTYEIRRDDRGFMVGDKLKLHEFDPSKKPPFQYTDRILIRFVIYKTPGGKFGLDPDYCVLGLGK